MNKWWIVGIITGVIILFFGSIVGTYNSLVSKQMEAQTQQAQIETQLQRRLDLVPNLVASVKGAMGQEQKVFKDIADARTRYAGVPSGTPEKVQAANQFESALGRLLVVMENYPQLQSIQAVQDFMAQLEGTENRISVARQRYNEAVRDYNRDLQTFPSNFIAKTFNFQSMLLFESTSGAKTAPKVDFGK